MSLMDPCVDAAAKRQRDAEAGQVTMFDLFGDESASHGFAEQVIPPNDDEWDRKMKLAFEKEMLGIYVSDHPLREIAEDVRAGSTATTAEVGDLRDGTMGWFAGMIASVDRRPTRTGKMMALIQIEDLDGSVEAVLFPQVFERYRDLITEDAVWRFRAKVENSDRGSKLIVQEIEPLVGRVIVHTDEARLANGTLDRLKDILRLYPGRDVLEIHVDGIGSTKMFRLQEGIDRDAHGLHAELIEVFGAQAVSEL
jgi:DNA polymerase-3 subunit alpha